MIRLHGYWRSGASYRARVALNPKRVAYEHAPVDLLAGDQRGEAYRALKAVKRWIADGFGVGLVPHLRLLAAAEQAHAPPAFAAAHPEHQSDARA